MKKSFIPYGKKGFPKNPYSYLLVDFEKGEDKFFTLSPLAQNEIVDTLELNPTRVGSMELIDNLESWTSAFLIEKPSLKVTKSQVLRTLNFLDKSDYWELALLLSDGHELDFHTSQTLKKYGFDDEKQTSLGNCCGNFVALFVLVRNLLAIVSLKKCEVE